MEPSDATTMEPSEAQTVVPSEAQPAPATPRREGPAVERVATPCRNKSAVVLAGDELDDMDEDELQVLFAKLVSCQHQLSRMVCEARIVGTCRGVRCLET